MNEKIKELWEEATGSCWPRPGKFTAGEYDYHLEKFAKLVVNECLTFVEPMPGSGDIDDLALESAHNGIKQHFGVEG